MTTRRDFVKSAGAAMAGVVGFPAAAFTHTRADVVDTSPGDTTALATNGYLASILPLADRAALREINVRLTRLAIDQCEAGGGAANQVAFGTIICLALADWALHGVTGDDLIRLSLDHDVVFPWSLLYGNARTPFNFRLTRLPLAIAFPRTVDEVAFWVNFVREHELSVSIRSGNNSYEGLSSTNDVVIDLTFLTLRQQGAPGAQFRIDARAGVVHAASGVRLGVLYTELAKRGLAFAGGQCPSVCVGGLVGTGGVGFSTREFGFACDQLVEVQYVLADGSVVVANAGNQYADLYQASKGAGAAGLGVMTRLTLRLVPAARVLFYVVTFDLDDAPEVLEAWQNLAATAPDALSSIVAAAAPTPDTGLLIINGEFRFEDGNVDKATKTLTDVLKTQWLNRLSPELRETPIVIEEMSTLQAANTVALEVPMPLLNQWKLKSKFAFRALTAAEFRPIVTFLQNHQPSSDPIRGAGFLNLLLMGGQSNRIAPNSAVVPAREGTVAWFHAGALWNDPALEEQSLAFVDELWAVMDPILKSSTAQYGCPDLQLGSQSADPPTLGYVDAFWKSPTHDFVPFLLGVKQKYDPADVFKGPQTIPLAL
jgi:hypothetical protein